MTNETRVEVPTGIFAREEMIFFEVNFRRFARIGNQIDSLSNARARGQFQRRQIVLTIFCEKRNEVKGADEEVDERTDATNDAG